MADDLTKPQSLYDTDYLAWIEQQAAALRARGGGANALDYDNLAEEIEDLGKSEFNACQSFVERIIEHLLKLQFSSEVEPRPHWRGEILAFRDQLQDRLTRTLENRLREKLPLLFQRQVRQLHRRELLDDPATVLAALPDGYGWDQITDPDWHPEPRA